MNYKPLITDAAKVEEIDDLLNKIALALDINNPTNSIGLHSGKSGIALFFAYYSLYKTNPRYLSLATILIEYVFKFTSANKTINSFSNGLSGITWTFNHLVSNSFIQANTDQVLGEIEEYMPLSAIRELEHNFFDYMHGGLGTAVYLIERSHKAFAQQNLNKMVDILYKNAQIENQEIKWGNDFITSHNETEKNQTHENTKEYNFGLSHGIPSIIALLSKLYSSNINKKRCQKLLTGSVNWLLKQQLENTTLSIFSNNSTDKIEGQTSRLAWCYGDLGISIALYQAAEALQDKPLQQQAIDIAIHSSKRRTKKETSVNDACLCHGTAGIAHIFNRMYQYTDRQEFKEAATYWYIETLKMAKSEDGVAGYKVWNGESNWKKEYGLLEGVAGIGLSLISAISNIEPKWDRCLLLS